MFVTDFEYDGQLLSSLGLMICTFNGTQDETISNGSELTLNTTPFQNGMYHALTSTVYEQGLTATFQISKDSCVDEIEELDPDQIREVMRWLNRKRFHEFRFMDGYYAALTFYATFPAVNRIEYGGKVIGLELTIQTDRPFALNRPIVKKFSSDTPNWKFTIGCDSDEESMIYPEMTITVKANGDLTLTNTVKEDDNQTIIRNCSEMEEITLNYPMISSNGATHDIANDFNYNWFGILSNFRVRRNIVMVNLPCDIEMKYAPIVKLGLM